MIEATPHCHKGHGYTLELPRGIRGLVYFHGVVPGKYVAAWPVFVVGDDPAGLAVVSERKIKEYLLTPRAEDDKAGFLVLAGYGETRFVTLVPDKQAGR